ncbi:MAG: hypothetical protein CMJ89_11450 [Planctomycetes bacterium]|nr:hypothetical protein [Planctomycetota bacterium]
MEEARTQSKPDFSPAAKSFSLGLLLLWGAGALLAGGVRFGSQGVPPAASQQPVYVALLPLLLVVHPWLFSSAWARRRPGRIALALLLIGGAYVIGTRIEDAFVSVLIACLWPLTAVQLWAMSSGRDRARIVAFPLLVFVIAAFVVELFGSNSGVRPVVWGRDETFTTSLPKEPPFIGPGGRLRPNLDVYIRSRELPQGVRMKTNSQGLRNATEIPDEVAPGELRILSLGDSFSIGMQVGQESFFGAQLEANLELQRSGEVTVVNAEVSDPVYGFYFLQEHAPKYDAEVVLLGICGNDLLQTDAAFGGGGLFQLDEEDRLRADPDYEHGPSPLDRYLAYAYPEVSPSAFEAARPTRFWRTSRFLVRIQYGAFQWFGKFCRFRVFYHALPVRWVMETGPVRMHSFVWETERKDGRMRLFDGTANLGYFYKRENSYSEGIYAKFFELLKAYDRKAKARGQRFVLIIFPQRYQVHREDWEFIRDFWNLDEGDFDLAAYNRRLTAFCEANEILCCDLLEAFRRSADDRKLYLPGGDIHFNTAGHDLAAREVAEFLRASGVR